MIKKTKAAATGKVSAENVYHALVPVWFLPSNQQAFLKGILGRSKSKEEVAACKITISIIGAVEKTHEGKGQEVLKGAHIVMEGRELFDNFTNFTSTRDRISSHYRGTKIAEKCINIPHHSDCLIGLVNKNDQDSFWIQLERHKIDWSSGFIKGIGLFCLHTYDFIKYKLTGKNVGPLGLSVFTELNPIVIPATPSDFIAANTLMAKVAEERAQELESVDSMMQYESAFQEMTM